MMGVTLSLGGLVVAGASGQFGNASNSANLGASLQQGETGVQASLVFSAVTPSGSCPFYRGFQEGTALTIGLFDYGSTALNPSGFVVNSTVYSGTFSAATPGLLTQYSLTLTGCAHVSGQTILIFDPSGVEIQVGT